MKTALALVVLLLLTACSRAEKREVVGVCDNATSRSYNSVVLKIDGKQMVWMYSIDAWGVFDLSMSLEDVCKMATKARQ